jgi:hypothetical protein
MKWRDLLETLQGLTIFESSMLPAGEDSTAEVGPESWRDILGSRVAGLDWTAITRDVEPFLEEPGDRRLLDRDLLISELGRKHP